jgi:lipopolysaccharide export system permease protein
MGSIDRYIFRTCISAFVLVLVSLTAVIWLTNALRDIDLMTNQGQTILAFIGITGLLIPLLVLVIAPIALMVAICYTLNKLNSDSEIVVMTASGMSPWRVFRPFVAVALCVSILVCFISAYLAPKGLRELREWITRVRLDAVTTIVQPGRFSNIENGLTFHIRERRPDGVLLGVFIDDRRDPKERTTFLAEQGEIKEFSSGTFLVLVNGSFQRHEATQRDPTIVLFTSHAFSLAQYTGRSTEITYSVRERYLWDLANPDPTDALIKSQPAQAHAELHDRISTPFYPVAFVVIAFAILGAPRTTRQSRGFSLGLAIVCVGSVRLVGFACAVFAVQMPGAVWIMYATLALSVALGTFAIARGAVVEPPEALTRAINALTERLTQRLAPA